MQSPLLSIVIIGRNEGRHLQRLHDSLRPLLERWRCETIFVDSASSDDSVPLACRLFDHTLVLQASPHLNASAGRWAAVGVATGRWALFLDGDMTFLAACLPSLTEHLERGRGDEGAIGTYVHQFADGSLRNWVPPLDRSGRVSHFGGAVLLPLASVQAENWDPRLYSNEEMELYTRLRARGVFVRLLPAPFVQHHTDTLSFGQKLHGNFLRRGSFLGKKFDGIGQVLHARIESGSLGSLVRWFPEPFFLWGCIAAALVLALAGRLLAAAGLLAAGVAGVAARKSPRVLVAYLGYLPQALHGFRNFDADWRPQVVQHHVRKP